MVSFFTFFRILLLIFISASVHAQTKKTSVKDSLWAGKYLDSANSNSIDQKAASKYIRKAIETANIIDANNVIQGVKTYFEIPFVYNH